MRQYFKVNLIKSFTIKLVRNYVKYKGYNKEISLKIIKRSEEFVNSITAVSWDGFWAFDEEEAYGSLKKYRFRFFVKFYSQLKKIFRLKSLYPDRKMRLSVRPRMFEEIAKNYVNDLLQYLGYDENKINILDQPFSADVPEKSFKFFKNAKAIIVDRDPRDLYILSRKVLGASSRWIPTDDYNSFIEYYKTIRKGIIEKQSDLILRIQFEDLIYRFDETIKTISSFIGIELDHSATKHFDPTVSINNTQLFVGCSEEELTAIKIIEDELSEYLYDFSSVNASPNYKTGVF